MNGRGAFSKKKINVLYLLVVAIAKYLRKIEKLNNNFCGLVLTEINYSFQKK